MRAVIVLFSILAVIAAEPISRRMQRIVGGSVTSISEYPYAASLLFSNNLVTYAQSCGGSIITSRSILSAAHCFFQNSPQQWQIRVGSSYANSGGSVHNTAIIIMHPNYNNWNLDNDIAILHTVTPIVYLPNAVQPGAIAGPNYNVPDNQVVWAIGWGRTSHNGPLSEELRHVQVWTINQATCRNNYAELGWAINNNMLCSGWLDVGGRDQCQQDSGSPLLHNNVIIGICSFGHQCALARYPGVNTRVSQYTDWIQANA